MEDKKDLENELTFTENDLERMFVEFDNNMEAGSSQKVEQLEMSETDCQNLCVSVTPQNKPFVTKNISELSCTRVLFSDSEESASECKPNSQDNEVKIPLFTVLVNTDKKVSLQVLIPLHKNVYGGLLSGHPSLGYTGSGFQDDHFACGPHNCDFDRGINVENAQHMFMRDYRCFQFAPTACLEPGLYNGYEVFISDQKKFVCALAFADCKLPTGSFQFVTHKRRTVKSKKHACKFCGKVLSCMFRHLQTVHKEELEVQELMKYDKGSKAKTVALRRITRKGDEQHNKYSSPQSRIFIRRPKIAPPSDGLCCTNCGGMILKRHYGRHHKVCSGRSADGRRAAAEAKRQEEDNKLEYLPARREDSAYKLLRPLLKDEVYDTITGDMAIMLLARHHAELYKSIPHAANNSRAMLKRCARLLLTARQLDTDISSMEDLLDSRKHDLLMDAVNSMCGLDENTLELNKPSVATLLGGELTKLAQQLKSTFIAQDMPEYDIKAARLDRFLQIHKQRYREITKGANRTLQYRRVSKKTVLPSFGDTKKFTDYVTSTANRCYSELTKKKDCLEKNHSLWTSWNLLGKCLLVQLLINSRRRVGETSRLLLTEYKNRHSVSDEDKRYLSRLQKVFADSISVMYTLGKRERRVPVFINKQQTEYMELYLSLRNTLGVPDSNPYLFGTTLKDGFLSAARAINDFAANCGASCPQTLRATYFRKQVATLSQLLKLSDNEIQQLADFMGHDVEVHKAAYRTPELTTHVTKLSQFFMAVGTENINQYRGRSLDDICVSIVDNANDSQNTSEYSSDSDYLDNDNDTPNCQKIPQQSEMMQHASCSNLSSHHSTPEKHWLQTSSESEDSEVDSKFESSISIKKSNAKQFATESNKTPPRNGNKRALRSRIIWTPREKKFLYHKFAYYFRSSKLPSTQVCREVAEEHKDILKGRSGQVVYAWIRCEKLRMKQRKIV